ncbi:hypothetical protein AVEN_256455-1 [Araneus ventricosus]|uniref:Uncharacterized protein n=1 Tax=Araneus ventricosus TaxID=182803 RepID=A0A4Y2R4H0_ARAVE|nr:hypothetical protein AVEN_256455-1 [Araneus ventricosus]
MGVGSDFLLELIQQFLSFANSMGTALKEDDTITQHARTFESYGFTMASDYFLLPKLKENLSEGTKFSSDIDGNTAAVNWLNEHGLDFYHAELKIWSCVQINSETDLVILWNSDQQVCLLPFVFSV